MPYFAMYMTYIAVCMMKVKDVIHLYPMWSAALQGNVERLAVDAPAPADGDEQDVPVCRTNAVVESHFKSVKHGRLDGRLRVRPREFVSAELKYVLGKVNERKLPKIKVSRRKDTAATEEKWNRRKRPARYADAAAASQLLKKIARRSSTTAAANDGTPVGKKVSDTAQKPAPDFPTTTATQPVTIIAASDVQNNELGDNEIVTALDHMHASYPHVKGLQHPGCGQHAVGKTLPRFQPVDDKFVQVFNIGDHWVTATNMFSRRPNTVYWYDSLHQPVSETSVVQLTSLLRRHTDTDRITVHRRRCHKQFSWSRLCGYYALAAAYAVCNGIEPTGYRYDAQTMVDVIDNNLVTGRVDQVPPAVQRPAVDIDKQVVDKLHCICRQPSATTKKPVTMIECSNCGNWYHVHCVSTTARQLRRESAEWCGPCCKRPATAAAPAPVIVMDDSSPPPTSTEPTAEGRGN